MPNNAFSCSISPFSPNNLRDSERYHAIPTKEPHFSTAKASTYRGDAENLLRIDFRRLSTDPELLLPLFQICGEGTAKGQPVPHRSPPSPKHTDTFLWVAGYPAGVKRLPRHMGDIRDCLFGLIVLEFWVSHDFPHRHQIIRGEIAGQALHRQPSEIHVSTSLYPGGQGHASSMK